MARTKDTEPAEVPGSALADLYSARLSEFVPRRAAIAKELAGRGEKAVARAVLALRKPDAAAWALNQLARRHPERLASLSAARVEAEVAQAAGDVSRLRDAIARYRAHLDELVLWVGTCLAEGGGASTRETLRAARETLEAAAQDPGVKGQELARACLVHTFASEDSVAEHLAFSLAQEKRAPDATGAPAEGALPPKAASDVVDLAARRRREHARRLHEEATRALAEAEANEAGARTRLEGADRDYAEAKSATERARARAEAAKRALSTSG